LEARASSVKAATGVPLSPGSMGGGASTAESKEMVAQLKDLKGCLLQRDNEIAILVTLTLTLTLTWP